MQTKTRSKPLLGLSALALLIGLSFASSSNVKSDLSHAVQTIQSVIFAPATTPNHSPIQLKGQGNKVHIKGKVLMTNDASNTLAASAENAQLYYGRDNTLDANNAAMLYGTKNKVYGQENTSIGGTQNHIGLDNKSSEKNLIIWGLWHTLDWNTSSIIGGRDIITKGNKNLILFGKQKTLNGNQNYALGSYINNQAQSNNFIWWDNKLRTPKERLIMPSSSNTFIIRSANGLGVNTNMPQGQGVTVNGMVQLGNENLTCNAKTLGAMKFQEINKNGKTEGCFYTCEKHGNEIKWYAMAKQACGAKQNTPVQPPVQPNPDPGNGENQNPTPNPEPEKCKVWIDFHSDKLVWGEGNKSLFLYTSAAGFDNVRSTIRESGLKSTNKSTYFRINSDRWNSYHGTFQIWDTLGSIDYTNQTRPIWSLGENRTSEENDYLITINAFEVETNRPLKWRNCDDTFKLVQCGQGSIPTANGCKSFNSWTIGNQPSEGTCEPAPLPKAHCYSSIWRASDLCCSDKGYTGCSPSETYYWSTFDSNAFCNRYHTYTEKSCEMQSYSITERFHNNIHLDTWTFPQTQNCVFKSK